MNQNQGGNPIELIGDTEIEIDQSLNVDSFIQTCKELNVDPDLIRLFGNKIGKTKGNVKLKVFGITEGNFDSILQGFLPVNYQFHIDTCLTIIVNIINKQLDGESGILPNNGRAAVFYVWSKSKVALPVIRIRRNMLHNKWKITLQRPDLYEGYMKGDVIFSNSNM